MTRKRYTNLCRALFYNMEMDNKKRGVPFIGIKGRRFKPTPNFGCIIEYGTHKGETLTSYKQSWDMIKEIFPNAPNY